MALADNRRSGARTVSRCRRSINRRERRPRRHETTAGYRTVQSKEVTWRRRPYVLDHIFYNATLRCLSYKVTPTLASDHHTLVADFEFVD